jgi:hypothetical protein
MTSNRNYYQRIFDLIDKTQTGIPGNRDARGNRKGLNLKRPFMFAALFLFALIAVAYVCDYCALRYKIARNRTPYGSVNVQLYYSMLQKNGKTEFIPGETQTQTCVHSLFPHMGYSPCWYASRRTDKRIEI